MIDKKLTYKDFFYCYSDRLKRFLDKKEIPHLLAARHNQNLKRFYLYQIDDELYDALQEFEIRRVMQDFAKDKPVVTKVINTDHKQQIQAEVQAVETESNN